MLDYVNKHSLPPLSRKEERECVIKAQKGDKSARDKLVMSNLKLIIYIIQKHYSFYRTSNIPLEDLVSAGVKGILEAIDKFDTTRNTRFITYAAWWIRQHINRELCNLITSIKVPEGKINLFSRINALYNELSSMRNREITTEEFLQEIENREMNERGVSLYVEMLKKGYMPVPLSLDQMVYNQSDDSDVTYLELQTSREADPQEQVIQNIEAEQLYRAIELLEPVEKQVLTMRYGLYSSESHSHREVAKILNTTVETVRNIERRALSKLKKELSQKF